MGLSINIAIYTATDDDSHEHFAAEFAVINELLAAAGLPRHDEPKLAEVPASRAECDSFPYSFLHYLRRVAAHRSLDPHYGAEPLGEGEEPTDDPAVEQAGADFDSHLLVHSDAEGYYVPVDFKDVIFDSEETGLPGGMLGSSNRLLRELVAVAPALGIELGADGALADAEAARINSFGGTDEGLYREYTVWIALYEAARLSVAHKTAIVFG